MSSCITGGGRAYRLDLEIIKSPSNSWTSNSSSPSSTLSESSNSPIAISTRKPRTPRKRPNQTYNEAAALLSTAYPKIFPTKHLTKPCKFTKQQQYPFSYETSSDLLQLPFQSIDNSSSFLIQQHQPKPISYPIPKKQANLLDKPCQSPGEINSIGEDSSELWDDFKEDFDAESILDEEIEEGIDSILGDANNVKKEGLDNGFCSSSQIGTCYGYPVGLGFGVNFEFGFGMRNNNRNIRAFRKVVDEGDWWSNQSVNIRDITPKFNKPQQSKKKKNSRSSTRENLLPSMTRSNQNNTEHEKQVAKEEADADADAAVVKPSGALLLKLDYDNILEAWSDRGFPFSDDSPASDTSGNDVHARLAKLDLFSENGGIREASVLRYKEKRRSRLFSKKIRYQVRKVNADRRPRMKGRFVRRQNSPDSEQG